MLSVDEAQQIVLKQARCLPTEITALTSSALGLVLAEDIVSDLDMPPHDKALMDGYAVRSVDAHTLPATLTVVEEVTAGQVPKIAVGSGQATRIMTGAPIPVGADAVVEVERTRSLGGQVEIVAGLVQSGRHILQRGREMVCGEVVVRSGTVIRPQEIGVLTAVGRTAVKTYPAPRVNILATGDELVEAYQKPGPGQLRNSNGPTLLAQASAAGAVPRLLGIARDRVDHLRSCITEGLTGDILILSGGVSAGKLDLVPGVLQELGVIAHFHKVEMKPGKPIFFGTRGNTLVFGLPGNPVSAVVCFELFVRPAGQRLAGHAHPSPRMVQAVLAEDFEYGSDRPTYHPARLEWNDRGLEVRAVPWFGSADLRGLLPADCFVLFPPASKHHRAGTGYRVLLMSGANYI